MSAIRISQVVAFSRTLSVHLNPQIEGTEIVCPQFSGGRFCQVVARTGSTVIAVSVENAKKRNETKRRCTSQQWRLHILNCWRSQLAGKPNAAAKCLVNEFQLLN